MQHCLSCGATIDEFDSAYYARTMLCIPCWTRKASELAKSPCPRCGVLVRKEEARLREGRYYCGHCFFELERLEKIPQKPLCTLCRNAIEDWQGSIRSPAGQFFHKSCLEDIKKGRHAARCIRCGRQTDIYSVSPDGLITCFECAKKGEGTQKAASLLVSIFNRVMPR
ncbi:MAG: hypothetical protein N3G22_00420 [Candidatus Micrarchaeota archaeon]|nr:hypothetical protein [Candidatus Micrarchaeota archaeon]